MILTKNYPAPNLVCLSTTLSRCRRRSRNWNCRPWGESLVTPNKYYSKIVAAGNKWHKSKSNYLSYYIKSIESYCFLTWAAELGKFN